ncbi:MAG TPA: thioesterase family protein [Candidatus Polarisedimenticolaceae bacterium]|nr:thioesterase family protein [Candidatus Polarisedimenticolaceae bacterium]
MSEAADRPARAHRTCIRVRYAETDRMGIAWHGRYLEWYETGRTELMRAAGCTYADVEDEAGIRFPVIEVGSRHLRPARYDDVVEIYTRVTEVRGARVRFDYELVRASDRQTLATGYTEHAAVGSDGRPTRLPPHLRARLVSSRPDET